MIDENKKAVELFDSFAGLYEQKYMNVYPYKLSLESFCEGLNRGSSVLDLACGPGNILKYLSETNMDYVLSGADFSEKMISLAKANVPSAQFRIEDCRYLSSSEKYNGVVCNFLIPYFNKGEVENLINKIGELVYENGKLLFGFITSDKNQSEIVTSSTGDSLLIHYHTEQFVVRRLERNGFEVNQAKMYNSLNPKQTQKDIIIVARKKGL